jgi:hypothetical protein
MLESSEGFEGVVPLLEDMLEPPDVRNVEQSFEYLHSVGLIDDPSDEGALTSTGNFVGSLPVGIMLGRLVAYAVMLGVAEEGVIVAAALSLPKSPFRIASPLVHRDPAEYNAIVQRIFLAASTFDKGVYSEPLMLMNLLRAWRGLSEGGGKAERWAAKYGIVKARMRYFDSVAKNLQQQVSKIVSNNNHKNPKSRVKSSYQKTSPALAASSSARSEASNTVPPCSPGVYNTLRLILLWTNANNNLLKLSRVSKLSKNPRQLILSGDTLLTPAQLESLFPPTSVPFTVTTTNENMCVMHMAASDYLEQHRSKNRLRDILIELLAIAATNDYSLIPVVWLKVEEMDENEDIGPLADPPVDKKESKKGKKEGNSKKNAHAGRTSRVSYMIAIASTFSEEGYDTVIKTAGEHITSKIEIIPCHTLRGEERAGGGGEEDGEEDGSTQLHYRVFRVEMFAIPICSTPTALDKTLCSCFSTFHLKLSFINKVKAIFKNCQVPMSMLHQMFHHLTPGDVEIKKSQIAAPSQCIDFLPEPEAEVTEEAAGGTQQRVWHCSSEATGLVDDVALGVRLYKAYMSGLGNGKG